MAATIGHAQSTFNRQHVDFAGWTGSAVDGVITGRDFDLYQLDAVGGDSLTVRLHSAASGIHFNVYLPGDGPGEAPLANSSVPSGFVPSTDVFNGIVPQTGVYTVAVYLTGAASRRDELAPYSIEFDLLDPTSAQDPDAVPLFFQVRTRNPGGHLNVHTGPDIDAPRLGRYDNGTILNDIGGCTEAGGREWCEVMAHGGGLAGYVAREFLAPVSPHNVSPVTPPRPTSTTRPTPTIAADITTTSDYFHVHLRDPRGHLNVHSEPSTRSVRVGRFPDGADLRNIGGCVDSGGRTWCDVMLAGGGVSGWVAAEFLRDGHPPAAHVTSSAGVPLPVVNDFADGMTGGPDFWRVDLGQAGSALRVHGQPSTRSPVFARFANGTTLRNADGCRMNEGRRWCYVSSVSGDVVGWVAGDFLVEGSAPGVATHLPVVPPRSAAPTPQPVPEQPILAAPVFDGSGTLPCVHDRDAAEEMCSYGTVQEGSGSGYLQITQAGYGNRSIFYENGVPSYFDQSQADGDIQMRVTRDGPNWIVFVGEMRFVIPVSLFDAGQIPEMATQLPLAPPPMDAEPDALVPGTEFNAMAQVSCVRDRDAAEANCEAGVVREGNGNGYVQVFWPDHGSRAIFFEDNTPVAFDQSQADGDAQMNVTRDGDRFIVFIGESRFVIPEALITGG
jgi:hypothetical protein